MNIIILSLIGAVIILDKYAIGEFGFSQPVIAGTIIGALFGNATQGIFLGGIFQLLFLGGLPIGRDIPPDGQAAGIVCCGSYFLLNKSNPTDKALLLACVFGLLASIIGGALEIATRKFNEKLYHQFLRNEDCLSRCHLAGILTAFARGFILFLPFYILAMVITLPEIFPSLSQKCLMIIGMGLGLANGINLFMKKENLTYGIMGVLCGLALLVF